MKAVASLRYSIKPVVRKVCTRMVMGKGYEKSMLFDGELPISAMTVRSEFDAFCLRQTINAGAEFRVVSALREVAQSDDHVLLKAGDDELICRYLIGADGANSRVRNLSKEFQNVSLGFALEACIPMPSRTPIEMEFDFGCVANGYGWVFPKDDHINVGLYTNSAEIKIHRHELNAYAQQKCGTRLSGTVVGHHIGLGGWGYNPKLKRVFLIGDAAGLVDPLLGEGIYFAIKSGQIAASAIEQAMLGKEDALRSFSAGLKPLQRELHCCHSASYKFYKKLSHGYFILTLPITRYALMRGFAMGIPFSEIQRIWWTFPFRKTPTFSGLYA